MMKSRGFAIFGQTVYAPLLKPSKGVYRFDMISNFMTLK